MKKNYGIMAIILLFGLQSVSAQVLWSDDFDGHTVGALSNDPSGNTAGQGNWYVVENGGANTIIAPESGRGNVVVLGGQSQASSVILRQKDIDVLWDNRATGNDILLLEYDFYMTDSFPSFIEKRFSLAKFSLKFGSAAPSSQGFNDIRLEYPITSNPVKWDYFGNNNHPAGIYENFPYGSWISVKFFIDYNSDTDGTYYLYIPSLNILGSSSFFNTSPYLPELLSFSTAQISIQQGVKFDNISISAIDTLPSYLGMDDFVSSKFNIFPNPVTDIITITNSENISIEEITLYDMNGKILKSLKFDTKYEVQLDIGNFASGTYMLHIKTNEGVAVKKVVKK